MVSGQHRPPTALLPEKVTPVPIWYDAGWTPEHWTWDRTSVDQPVARQFTELSLFMVWSVDIALGYGLDDGVLGFDSQRGLGIFLFTTASRPALGPTMLPIQWVPGALSLGVKRPGHEAGHSLPPSAEVKQCVELYLHSPIRLYGEVLS
jgi:hypothetical protein